MTIKVIKPVAYIIFILPHNKYCVEINKKMIRNKMRQQLNILLYNCIAINKSIIYYIEQIITIYSTLLCCYKFTIFKQFLYNYNIAYHSALRLRKPIDLRVPSERH